jgi:hypothetical protein
MRRVLLFVLGVAFCLCVVAPLGRAQNSTASQQSTSTSTMIDGAVHPELISDSMAYRMYFVSISLKANPAAVDQEGQQARLNAIGLETSDVEILADIMADFRAKHDAVVAQYNQAAEAATARGESSDIHTLLQQLDQLVQNTRDTLKARLSSKGMTQLDAFVQAEKRHMKVQTGAS